MRAQGKEEALVKEGFMNKPWMLAVSKSVVILTHFDSFFKLLILVKMQGSAKELATLNLITIA